MASREKAQAQVVNGEKPTASRDRDKQRSFVSIYLLRSGDELFVGGRERELYVWPGGRRGEEGEERERDTELKFTATQKTRCRRF